MITAEQIRGARALLDWTIKDLAQKTGLTVNGINKIERSHVAAQRDTLSTIRTAFESEGVEFLPNSGLRRKSEMVFTMRGKNANHDLALDIYDHLHPTGGELLIMHADQDKAAIHLDREFMSQQFRKRKKAKITHRLFAVQGAGYLYPELKGCYHGLPSEYLSSTPFFVYGRRFALLVPENTPKVVIVENERIASTVTKLFNYVWDHTIPLTSQNTKPIKKSRPSSRKADRG